MKDNLARLFKSEPGKIDALFGGRPVVLKRELPEAEADRYLAALHQAGANAHKEVDLAASLSLVETPEHNPGRGRAPGAGPAADDLSQVRP